MQNRNIHRKEEGKELLGKNSKDTGGEFFYPPANPLFFLLLVMIGIFFFTNSAQYQELSYSGFLTKLKNGSVDKVTIKGVHLTGELKKEGKLDDREKVQFFSTTRVDPALANILQNHGVNFRAIPDSGWNNILPWVLGIIIIFSFASFMARKAADDGGGGYGAGSPMTFGKSKARIYVQNDTRTTFEDVAGADEAKEELKEVISFIKEPERYRQLGAKLPKGILLVGPPGTGKTLLARALAGEAEVPFLSISGSEFVEMFVGVGASRVRDLFEQAQKYSPCIIFIDELDALGRSRGINPISGSNDEKEQTLNQLLSELDGFDSMDGVILIAATNRPEILDQALLRAGRFDRQIVVDRPSRSGRNEILKVHTKSVTTSKDIDLESVARMTPGFSGADLANLVNEATLLAARDRASEVDNNYIMKAFERVIGGLEKKGRVLSIVERNIVAYHEIGHALVSLALPGCDTLQKVSIIPRGVGTLGYTINLPNEDRFIMSINELNERLTVLLAGRAAEEVIFGLASTGASDDFEKATAIARDMVTRFGMTLSLGMVTYEKSAMQFLDKTDFSNSLAGKSYSDTTASKIDLEIRVIIDNSYKRARSIIDVNQDKLKEAAIALLEKESLDRVDLLKMLSNLKVPEQYPVFKTPKKESLSELIKHY